MSAFTWTDELREKVVKMYQDQDPNPENTTEIVKQIAEEIGATPNGVRMVLQKAEVYISKVPVTNTKSKRVSKAAAIEELVNILEANELEVNEDIINKLTGKAALYFVSLFKELVGE